MTESIDHPEVLEARNFLRYSREFYRVYAWLGYEQGAAETAANEQRIGLLLKVLGVNPDPTIASRELHEIESDLEQRALHPRPVFDLPRVSFFEARIQEILNASRRLVCAPMEHAVGSVTLQQVIACGHTEWDSIRPRGQGSIGEYTHRMAEILADPVAYQLCFARRDFGYSDSPNDHLAVRENWRIANGRHRSLALLALGQECVKEAEMNRWVPVYVLE